MCLPAWLVFGADTRTNAGVDYVTTYSKMHCVQPADDRVFVILSAGNLATTQEILSRLQCDLDTQERTNLGSVHYMFEAAHYLGQLSQEVQASHAEALSRSGTNGETTFILGGQIQGQPHELFLIYPQGNYIHTSSKTLYLQIGESKYGKPVLDRILEQTVSLDEGAKLALMSLDATIRSNVSVGPPVELAMYPTNSLRLPQRAEITADSPFYITARTIWQEGLRETFNRLPNVEWTGQPQLGCLR
jgi:putative proteasome-type protease